MTLCHLGPILPGMRYAEVKPAWIICRKSSAFPIDDDAALLQWAERGRIRRDDYIVDRRLDICVQAKEIAEVEEIFQQTRLRRLRRISPLLAWFSVQLHRHLDHRVAESEAAK